MSTHDRFRERIALGLYDELDAGEARELSRHLSICAECRGLADEMRSTLGVLAGEAKLDRESGLPPGWEERLRSSVASPTARHRTITLLAAASSFAAGLLLMWVLLSRGTVSAPGSRPEEAASSTIPSAVAFERATPPPHANVQGGLSRLGAYLKR